MIPVTLNEVEQALAKHIAKRRHESNRLHGVTNKKVGVQDNASTDLDGTGGELAFCKVANLYPDFEIVPGGGADLADARLPDGRRVDVKTTPYMTGNLLAREIHDEIDIFVLVGGKFPSYVIVGFATRAELEASGKRKMGDGSQPSHFMAADTLHPIEELIALALGQSSD